MFLFSIILVFSNFISFFCFMLRFNEDSVLWSICNFPLSPNIYCCRVILIVSYYVYAFEKVLHMLSKDKFLEANYLFYSFGLNLRLFNIH